MGKQIDPFNKTEALTTMSYNDKYHNYVWSSDIAVPKTCLDVYAGYVLAARGISRLPYHYSASVERTYTLTIRLITIKQWVLDLLF